jgi:hypothetical protein
MRNIFTLIFLLTLFTWQSNAQYCTPSALNCSVGDEINDFTIPSANFSHLGTGCSANTYGDFTGDATLEIDLSQTVIYDFQITHNFGSQFVKIWIDFNENQTFEDSEVVFVSSAGSNPTNGSFSVPLSASQVTTRMRVMDVYFQEPSDPCSPTGSYGETHDYTVNILPPPPCPMPTNLVLDEVQGESADFSWDNVTEATNGYIWEVFAQGDDPETATPVSTGTFAAGATSGTASGLTDLSDYDFYLTADCDTDGTSFTNGPVAFSTSAICPEPTDISLDNLLNNSADISFVESTNASNGHEWQLFAAGDDPSSATPLQSNTLSAGTNTVSISGLTQNTAYDFYLQADCGSTDGQSLLTGPLNFTTDCDAITAPFTENFDGNNWTPGTGFGNSGDEIDDCWSRSPDGSNGDYFWGTRTDETGSGGTGPDDDLSGGGNYVYTESSNGSQGDEAILSLPLVDVSSLTTPGLQFYYHMFGTDTGQLKVEVKESTDSNWTEVFSISGQQQIAISDPFIEQYLDLSAFSGVINIRFIGVRGGGFSSDMAIDEVSVIELPSCLKPFALSASAITSSSADLLWTAGGSETEWEVIYGSPGFDPATEGTTVADDDGTLGVTLDNLTSNTTYEYYVSAVCSATETSDLSLPSTFTTLCDTFTAPYVENFDGSNWVPGSFSVDDIIDACWSRDPNGTNNGFYWGTGTGETGSADTGPDDDVSGGGQYVFVESSNGSQDNEAFLTSPAIDVSALTTPSLIFQYHMFGEDINELKVEVKETSASTWTGFANITGAQQTAISDPFAEQIIDLSSLSGEIQVRFIAVRGSSFAGDIAIDEVKIDELPTCISPSPINVSNVNPTSADVSWSNVSNATDGYDWELYNAGDDPSTATPVQNGNVQAGTTTLTLTSLSDGVSYDFYINSNCGSNGLSDVTGPATISTPAFPPINDDICDAIDLTVGVVPPGDAYTNVSATEQPGEPTAQCFNDGINGSVWFTFTAPASGEVEVSTDIAGATLTDTEIAVYEAPTDCTDASTMGNSLGCNQDGGVNIGFNSILNLTGLTGGDTYYVQVDRWGSTADGDFGISVIDTDPPCPAPSNVVLNSTTENTADLSWDILPEASDGYNWYVFNQGADVTSDPEVTSGSVPNGTTTVSISGLAANTSYDFYVEANCGSTIGVSSFSDVLSFSTDCAAFTAPYSDNFDGSSWVPGTGFGNNGDAIDICWSRNPDSSTGGYLWGTRTGETGSSGTGPASDLSTNGNYIYTESSNGVTGDEANFETPFIDVSTLNSPVIKFYYHMFGGDMGTLHVDVDDGSGYTNDVFTLSGQQQTDLNDPWIEQFVDLGAFSGETIKIRFRGERGTGFTSDMAIDEVSLEEAPACLKPTGITLVNEFFDSGEFSWDPITNATAGYEWEVYAAGDDPATATPVSTGTVPAGTTQTIADGLSPETDYEFYVRSNCGTTDGLSELSQPVAFTTTVLCAVPNNFEAINLLPDGVDLNWTTIPNDANGYNWSVFNAGDNPVNDTPVASGNAPSGSSSVNVTGLSPNTSYDAYIETDCGADGISDLSVAISFTTTCQTFTAPFNESFDGNSWVSGTGFTNDGDAIDGCWDRAPDGLNSNYFWGTKSGETGSANTGPNDDFTGGGKYVFTESSSGDSGDEAIIETPLIDASALNVPQLRFYYHMFGGDMGTLHVDVNEGSGYTNDVFTISGEQQTDGSDDWVLVQVTLPSASVQNLRIRFRGERGDGFSSDMAIDEVSLVEAPTCPQPSNLSVSNITDTSVDVSWDATLSSQNTFDLEVLPAGTDPTGVPTIEDVTSNPYAITDLNSETAYDIYVRADCGGGDESFWIGPVSFNTAITPIIVTESNPATGNTYCYGNSDFKEWLFIKDEDSDEELKITFNSGILEEDPLSSDQLLCFDGFDESAPLLYDSQVDGDDPSGLTITAPSGVIYMTLTSDIFGSCEGGTEDLDPIDFDVYLGTLGADEFEKSIFEFFPNPVTDKLNLRSENQIEKLVIYNMIGQRVKTIKSINSLNTEIPMSDLQSGAYLLQVTIDNKTSTFNIIKE